LARSEDVKYSCDVCGKTAVAQKVPHPDGKGWNFVRPDGWGNLYLVGQAEEQRVTTKRDFCSEECLDRAYAEFVEKAYGE
jgi:hypothetical protein